MAAAAATSEDFVDATIAALKILGMVPKNGKLCIRKGQLCIDSPRAQWMRRWMNGDSRDLTLIHAKDTINNSIKIARAINDANSFSPTGMWTLERILTEMERCRVGLQNLKTTYADDSAMVANLDVLIERQTAHSAEVTGFVTYANST
jgi:hypothetical protein